MEESQQVAIFWDYENCAPPSSLSGYELVRRIRDVAHEHGSIKSFKAYTELSEQNSPRSIALRSELQSSGVSIIDCPHNGYKNVADQMMIADMLMFAMDNPYPLTTTVLLISGDRDFCYSLSSLRLRMYNVAVIAPPNIHPSLRAQVSTFSVWSSILAGTENASCTAPQRPRSCPRSVDLSSTVASSSSSQIPRKFPLVFGFTESPVPPYGTPSSSHTHSRNISRPHDTEQVLPRYSTITPDTLPPKTSFMASRSLDESRNKRNSNAPRESATATSSEVTSIADSYPPSAPVPAPQQSTLRYESPSVESAMPAAPSPPLSSHRAPLPPSPRPHSTESSSPGVGATVADLPQAVVTAAVAQPGSKAKSPDVLGMSDVDPDCPPNVILNSASALLPSPQLEPYAPSTNVATTSSKDESTRGIVLSLLQPRYHSEPSTLLSVTPQTNVSQPRQSPPILTATASPATVAITTVAAPAPAPLSHTTPKMTVIPQHLLTLVQYLEKNRLKGIPRPLRTTVSVALAQADKQIYQRAGCTKWADFAAKAESMRLIKLGGAEGKAWIELHPDLHGRIELKSS